MKINRFIRLLAILAVLSIFSPRAVQADTPDQPVYIVQSGDTLYSIALQFGVSEDDLINANDIADPNQLKAGDSLVIPGLQGISGTLITETVQLGDSLQGLSRRYQIPVDMLIHLNHITSPEELYVGSSLIIPEQDNQATYSENQTLDAGQGVLGLAAQEGVNPWSLVLLNGFDNGWEALPGDPLATPGTGQDQSATGTPAVPSNLPTFEIDPAPLVQGDTVVIKVGSAQQLTLSGSFMGHDLHFFPGDNGDQIALSGVNALADPGLYPIQLQWTTPDGKTSSLEQAVNIVAGIFATDPPLEVDPSTIDPAITGPEDQKMVDITTPATSTRYWSGVFQAPGNDPTWITAGYGDRRTYNTDTTVYFHTGVDYGGGVGLPIKAPAPGVVVFTGLLTVRGNATIIDHGWGVYSALFHQSEIDVKVGDHVDAGQVIGLYGDTGRVTGPHLHWDLWVDGVQVDPLDWLDTVYP